MGPRVGDGGKTMSDLDRFEVLVIRVRVARDAGPDRRRIGRLLISGDGGVRAYEPVVIGDKEYEAAVFDGRIEPADRVWDLVGRAARAVAEAGK